MISVSHKIQSDAIELIKDDLIKVVEHFKTKDGFSHYRLLEPLSSRGGVVLLTFWKSIKHYRRAISR